MSFFFAWLAALGFGLETVFGKPTSKHTLSDPWLFNFTYPLVILFFTIILSSFNQISLPQHWLDIILAGLFQALAFTFLTLSIFNLDVSLFSPLFNFRSVFSVLLGALLLGEVMSGQQYLLVALIFFAGLFVSMDEKLSIKSFFTKPVALVIIDTFLWSLTSIFINKAAKVENYWTISLWVGIFTQVFLLTTIPLFYKKIKLTKSKDYLGVIVMAVAGVIATLASNKAVSENVGISTVIMSLPTSMIIAFLFSILAPTLLEKHTKKVYLIRFIAATVMVACAIKLSN